MAELQTVICKMLHYSSYEMNPYSIKPYSSLYPKLHIKQHALCTNQTGRMCSSLHDTEWKLS